MPSSRREASHSVAVETIDRLISLKQVEPIAGLKRTAITERVKEGTFPEPVRLSSRCTRWRLSEVTAWVATLGKQQ